jgi:hypothetical protein
MDRRSFLSRTLAGVAALALTNKYAFAASSTGFSPLMSIGFAPALPPSGGTVRLADALSVLLPDPTFLSHGARVTVAGSARAAKHAADPGGVAVDAAMSKRFRFWSAAQNGASGNLSFTVPVTATSGIDFVARRMKQSTKKDETATAPAADVDPAPFTLSLGSAAGPKLQRGVYVVALRESAGEAITDWSRFSIVADHGAYGIPGADFGWVMLQIDYAK